MNILHIVHVSCRIVHIGSCISADIPQAAPFTGRCRPRRADLTPVQHEPVAEGTGFLRGDHLPKLPLDLERVFAAVGESEPSGDADAVGVTDIGFFSVDIAQDQVCGFAADTGKL